MAANFIRIKGTSHITLYLDVSNAKISGNELEKRLRELSFLEEVYVKEPKPLFLDAVHFPLTNGLERVCLITTNALARMYEEMIDIFGSGAFTVLWRIGLNVCHLRFFT